MASPSASLLLATMACAWLLCIVNAQPNATVVPATTKANGPVPATGAGAKAGKCNAAQPIDFTTGPAATLAFVHLSFGINVWNPQLTVATFNKPGIKAQFAQSIKNAVPDAVVVSEALPANKGILVRSTVRFQTDAAGARAQADALVKYLTTASLLKQMLPEANWHPVLAYTTFPYLASAVVQPVGTAANRTPSLHFTVRVPGIKKAAFDAQKLAAWRAALKAALPGLTDQGLKIATTESTEVDGRKLRTDTLVHAQVAGPTLKALRLFSPQLLNKPQAIWSRKAFGAVEAVPCSWVIVAFAAPCAKPRCTAYASSDCTCTACEPGWKPSAGACVKVGCPNGQTLLNGNCCPNARACGSAGCCTSGTECINGKCGTLVRGNPDITLRWYAAGATDSSQPARDDLDLHVLEPGTETQIYFRNRVSPSGGTLDVDANANCLQANNPVEHVRWAAGSTPPTGTYTVWVELYKACTDAAEAGTPIKYDLTIEVNGRKVEYTGTLTNSLTRSQNYTMVYP